MSKPSRLALAAVVGVVVLAALWFASGVSPRRAPTPATSGGARVIAGSLDDLLMDLQIVPMDGQPPKAFELESLDGRRVALASFADRPLLLYFWATW